MSYLKQAGDDFDGGDVLHADRLVVLMIGFLQEDKNANCSHNLLFKMLYQENKVYIGNGWA